MDYFNPNYSPKGQSNIANAIKKHGLANFHLTIIIISNAPSSAVITLEQYFLSYFPMTYNILRTAGTVVGRLVSKNEREYFMRKYGTRVFVYTKNKELLYQFYSIKDFCKTTRLTEDSFIVIIRKEARNTTGWCVLPRFSGCDLIL
jgi:hypothetical protein